MTPLLSDFSPASRRIRRNNSEHITEKWHPYLFKSMRAATSLTIISGIVIAFAHQCPSQIDGTAQPTPSCSPPCSLPVMWSENFDNVTPPALPPGWLATNAQGQPPFWITSNSGVPIPPADTLPNAAFIDDPAVVSDKRLYSLPIPP